jgi:hypothetical protein
MDRAVDKVDGWQADGRMDGTAYVGRVVGREVGKAVVWMCVCFGFGFCWEEAEMNQ